jgi:hypothetical protein
MAVVVRVVSVSTLYTTKAAGMVSTRHHTTTSSHHHTTTPPHHHTTTPSHHHTITPSHHHTSATRAASVRRPTLRTSTTTSRSAAPRSSTLNPTAPAIGISWNKDSKQALKKDIHISNLYRVKK